MAGAKADPRATASPDRKTPVLAALPVGCARLLAFLRAPGTPLRRLPEATAEDMEFDERMTPCGRDRRLALAAAFEQLLRADGPALTPGELAFGGAAALSSGLPTKRWDSGLSGQALERAFSAHCDRLERYERHLLPCYEQMRHERDPTDGERLFVWLMRALHDARPLIARDFDDCAADYRPAGADDPGPSQPTSLAELKAAADAADAYVDVFGCGTGPAAEREHAQCVLWGTALALRCGLRDHINALCLRHRPGSDWFAPLPMSARDAPELCSALLDLYPCGRDVYAAFLDTAACNAASAAGRLYVCAYNSSHSVAHTALHALIDHWRPSMRLFRQLVARLRPEGLNFLAPDTGDAPPLYLAVAYACTANAWEYGRNFWSNCEQARVLLAAAEPGGGGVNVHAKGQNRGSYAVWTQPLIQRLRDTIADADPEGGHRPERFAAFVRPELQSLLRQLQAVIKAQEQYPALLPPLLDAVLPVRAVVAVVCGFAITPPRVEPDSDAEDDGAAEELDSDGDPIDHAVRDSRWTR